MKPAPHLMRTWERRALTDGEIRLGRTVFGDEIDWRAIRIVQAPRLGFGAMVPLGRTIVFSRWRAARDFSKAHVSEQGWLVHELMHVWQAARGAMLPFAKLGALGDSAYICTPRAAATLDCYNIEAQAEIARFLFLARQDKAPSDAPPREWLEDVWARR